MTKVKICGIRRAEDITYANEFQPEYIGFVFAKGSGRYLAPDRAAQLRVRLSRNSKAVGVFVNEPLENIRKLLESGTIDLAQIHGSEGADYIRALKRRTGKPIIQAFRVASTADADLAEASPADFVLLDHGAGGTGKAFDWSLVSGVRRPFFLAGGLSPENVGEAIARCHPFAVDASSMLETDGFKDPDKMKRFIDAVRMN
jgi:phosphoribosylanthranilate isomerase